ncbi:MAG: hypothetical protein AB1715_14575, partial [Acidobacteriota bacterium]
AIQEELGIRHVLVKVPFAVQVLVAALAEAAARRSGKKPLFTRQSVVATRRYFWVYDGSKIKRALGFEPRTGLKEAIRETIAWCRQQGKI